MAKRYFFFMYPSQSEVRSLLNMAVFCLDPNEKWPAHITVAGPYQTRPKVKGLFNGEATAFALGCGNFFREGLSTVYLKVGVQNIWSVWRKPDFLGNPVPHLSLYNGKDRQYAEKIFTQAMSINPYFSFRSSGLSLVSSISGQQGTVLREQIDTKILDRTANMKIDEIRDLNSDERLELAMLCLAKLKLSANSKRPLNNEFVLGQSITKSI